MVKNNAWYLIVYGIDVMYIYLFCYYLNFEFYVIDNNHRRLLIQSTLFTLANSAGNDILHKIYQHKLCVRNQQYMWNHYRNQQYLHWISVVSIVQGQIKNIEMYSYTNVLWPLSQTWINFNLSLDK